MKKIILFALILVSSLNAQFAHNGDTTCTENCKETTLNTLVGEWTFTKFSFSIIDKVHACEELIVADDAFLKFQFDEDGTYSKYFGAGDDGKLEVGTWDITDDNHNLILLPADGSAAQFIKIKEMEDEKVVLKLDIAENGLQDLFCSKINVLNFSKNILPLSDSVIR
jgi:hypothetical protein